MRASVGSRHLSGAERIVAFNNVEDTVRDLVVRATGKGCRPDQIILTIDHLKDPVIQRLPALDLITLAARDAAAGRSAASQVLQRTGVSSHAASAAINHIVSGASPSGGAMRGAMIIDAQSGERLEPDAGRGVRASRFDWSEEAADKIRRLLSGVGLTHFRTMEALALATKVAHAPGVMAELCWSDDPDYTAGYVASLKTGYVRFPFLKDRGDEKGGRVFFIDKDKTNIYLLIEYLQTTAVLIVETGMCRPEIGPEEFFEAKSH